jgi:hypothetical protein
MPASAVLAELWMHGGPIGQTVMLPTTVFRQGARLGFLPSVLELPDPLATLVVISGRIWLMCIYKGPWRLKGISASHQSVPE